MNKIDIKTVVSSMLKLQEQNEKATLLGIGPMSTNCVRATLELSKEYDFPVMFIASRNQVDAQEFGGGYVNGWNQFTFAQAVSDVAKEIDYDNMYYLCRDHGGPWQRDSERNAHLESELAMKLGKESFLEDLKAGFDLLMVDPTKDPFEVGKVIELDTVLNRTVDLIEYCEKERIKLGLPVVGYEVGTEETNGGLTSKDKYEEFIIKLEAELVKRGLPTPTFIVGQTGTLTRKTEQVGNFNFQNASELAVMAKKYNVGLKEHNGDYLDDVTLLEHIPSQITATNVAPQYGTYETRAYVNLCEVENKLYSYGLIKEKSKLYDNLVTQAIKSERWRKWLTKDQEGITEADILKDSELTKEILDIAGHYTFNEEIIKLEKEVLYNNLKENNIDGNRYVINYIKRPIRDYVECYNLSGLTSKIKKINT